MELTAFKLDGAGNDFVCLTRTEEEPLSPQTASALARALCHRTQGIGADGLMIIEAPPVDSAAAFSMRYLNADGSPAATCGNGARCIARLAVALGIARPSHSFETPTGLFRAEVTHSLTRVYFPDIAELPSRVYPSAGAPVDFLNTGVPHAVRWVKQVGAIDVAADGRELRFDEAFGDQGTNVNFAQVEGPMCLRLRTYERGVEGETQACGSGAVAAAVCFAARHQLSGPIEVTIFPTSGQRLSVAFDLETDGVRAVSLAGPARIVFRTEVRVDLGAERVADCADMVGLYAAMA